MIAKNTIQEFKTESDPNYIWNLIVKWFNDNTTKYQGNVCKCLLLKNVFKKPCIRV